MSDAPLASVPMLDIYAWSDKTIPALRRAASPIVSGFVIGLVLGRLGEEKGWEFLRAMEAKLLLAPGSEWKKRSPMVRDMLIEAGMVAPTQEKPRIPVSKAEKGEILLKAGYVHWDDANVQSLRARINTNRGVLLSHREHEIVMKGTSSWWLHPKDASRSPAEHIHWVITLNSAWRRFIKETPNWMDFAEAPSP